MISTNNLFRRFLVACWRSIQRIRYRLNNNIKIESSVRFNPHTLFGTNIWIHKFTNINDTHIGSYTYIQESCRLEKCHIGRFCSIGDNVKVLSATHPTRDFVSTSPVFYSVAEQCCKSFVDSNFFEELKRINGYSAIIGNDVWIGSDVTILGGTIVGDGAIIATGAVVNKNVPPYAVVAGIPAKIIRYRFSEEQINVLLADKWWEKSDDWLKRNAKQFIHINKYLKLLTNER
jgi:acetyltransferase-like isoleucine patch superfamily enzyme